MNRNITIAIKQKTHERLKERRLTENEYFDEVIRRLLNETEKP